MKVTTDSPRVILSRDNGGGGPAKPVEGATPRVERSTITQRRCEWPPPPPRYRAVPLPRDARGRGFADCYSTGVFGTGASG